GPLNGGESRRRQTRPRQDERGLRRLPARRWEGGLYAAARAGERVLCAGAGAGHPAAANAKRACLRGFAQQRSAAGFSAGQTLIRRRVFSLDQNHAVSGAQTIVRQTGGVLQNFDGGNVVGIDPEQSANAPGLNGDAVDDVEGLHIGADRRITANAYGNSPVGSSGDHDTRNPRGERCLYRIPLPGAIDVVAGNRCGREWGSPSTRRSGVTRSCAGRNGGAAGGKPDKQGVGEDAKR